MDIFLLPQSRIVPCARTSESSLSKPQVTKALTHQLLTVTNTVRDCQHVTTIKPVTLAASTYIVRYI